MSAPNTNVERQARRHRPALWGISLALAVAAIAIVAAFMWSGVPTDEQAAPTVEGEAPAAGATND